MSKKMTKPSVTELMEIALMALEGMPHQVADILDIHEGFVAEFRDWLKDSLDNEAKPLPVFGLDDRETATVLAALRYWQMILERGSEDPIEYAASIMPQHFDEETMPLHPRDIDALCERVNEP